MNKLKKNQSLTNGAGSSVGGASDIGDQDMESAGATKIGQRQSAREKRPVNYNSIVAGTGELSASMDYGEVSG